MNWMAMYLVGYVIVMGGLVAGLWKLGVIERAGDSDRDRDRVRTVGKGDIDMAGGKTDELKGRVKEAAGVLTGNAKLKREGRLDQTAGKVKQTAEKAIDKVKDAVK